MAWTNYATICRLCLQQNGFLLAIFNNHVNENIDSSIQSKIMECTALELSSEDGLPPLICHRCLYKVELCLEFKQQCLLSDATLKNIICKNGEISNGPQFGDAPYRTTTVSVNEFEKFSHENQKFIPDHGQNVENVVMVINPDLEYDSDNESEYEHHNVSSDVENADTGDISEQLRNVFMCKYCDRAYTEREQCHSHEMSEHNGQVPFLCAQCEMAFADRTNYTAHLKSVHQNDKPFGCPQCPRSFSRRSDLRKHTVVHTGIKPYTCQICYKSFSRNTNLTKHLRIHSGHKPYVCPQCPKTFISKGDLTRHALIHSGHKPFACGYCEQSFGRRDKLLRHEKRHFPNGNEDRSEAVSAELEMLRQQMALSGYSGYSAALDTYGHGHQQHEHKVKQELIDDTDTVLLKNNGNKVIDTRILLQADVGGCAASDKCAVAEDNDEDDKNWHQRGENMVINVDPFNHDDTNELLPPRVPEHITGDNDFIGDASATATVTATVYDGGSSSIQQLKSTVNAIKKYPCFVCHKRFSSAESLRFHTATHSGQKPHSCHQCTKSFLRKRELDRHMATHTGMKPFKCLHCDKRFGRKDKLVRHSRIHAIVSNVASCTSSLSITTNTTTASNNYDEQSTTTTIEQIAQ